MNEVIYDKARSEDHDDCIDFADFVFSQAHDPHDFMKILPKLYKREYFMESIHYLAREGGKIKAMIGSYPLKYEFAGGAVLHGMGIGAVSVHPRSRSKGYMKVLMGMALDDMKKDGMVFSCLGGQRQRYEYFGYTHSGCAYNFTVREPNIRHSLGADWKTGLEVKPVFAADTAMLDKIRNMHENKNARLFRNPDRFFDIISSWDGEIFAVTENGRFEGYYICRPGSWDVSEINMEHPERIKEVLGLLLRRRREIGAQESVAVSAGPHETEKIAVLSGFAESCRQSSAYQFNILDFKRFTEPFIKLRSNQRAVADGSFVLKIEGSGTFTLASGDGRASIAESAAAPDLTLSRLEAVKFLFDPLTAAINPAIQKTVFLQSLLPLPLFYENTDGI
ncbi:MAG: GNAT family N-acetyltransferase [Treponema sp.]|nr:GNAT family N-acetyltransferase [Treponema sp.]